MSFRRLVTLLSLMAVFAMATRVATDSDTWWHLRAGAWMVEHRSLLRTDPFSLTRQGQPWVYPGWLAQLALYGVFALLGHPGLNLLVGASVVIAFWAVWKVMPAPELWRGFVLVLAAAAAGVFWAARPHIFTFALFGVWVALLERWQTGDWRSVGWLPPLMALWVNLHGGFAAGFLLLAAYGAGEVLARWLPRLLRIATQMADSKRPSLAALGLSGALSLAAVSLNPHGPAMLLYPFRTVSIGVLRQYIEEWQSPNFHRPEVQPFLWLLLLVAAFLALSPRRPRAGKLLSVLGFAALALMAGRNIALFALPAAPVLARHGWLTLQPLAARIGRGREVEPRLAARLNLALFGLAGLAVVLKVSQPLDPAFNERALAERFPAGAVAYLREAGPPGPLFNSYNWGGYVLWTLYPAYLSFVDGRTDLFDDEVLESYVEAWRGGDGWREVFERWGIRLVLLEPDAPLLLRLRASGWRTLYRDDMAVVMGR